MNNVKNTLITRDILSKILSFYTKKDITINPINLKYYINATIHKSFCNYKQENYDIYDDTSYFIIDYYLINNNERLEYLGDAQLYAIIAEYLYDRYPDKDEGFMTKLRIQLIKKENLSFLCRQIGLDRYLLISKHLEINKARYKNDSLLENLFESFIGALYKDQGFEITKSFVTNVIEMYTDFTKLIETSTDYKSKLLMFFHSKKFNEPKYTLLHKKLNKYIDKNGKEITNGHMFYTCIILNKSVVENSDIKSRIEYYSNKTKEIIESKYTFPFDFDYSTNYYLFIGFSDTLKDAQQKCSKMCYEKLTYKKEIR